MYFFSLKRKYYVLKIKFVCTKKKKKCLGLLFFCEALGKVFMHTMRELSKQITLQTQGSCTEQEWNTGTSPRTIAQVLTDIKALVLGAQ